MAHLLTRRLQLFRIAAQARHHGSMYDHRFAQGKREVVGFGFNNTGAYVDAAEFPFPKVRWQEPTQRMNALRKKEMGDWRQLSLEEKKTLYRYSFRQTFAEMKAPTGEWKKVIGFGLIVVTISLWMSIAWVHVVYRNIEYPMSLSDEWKREQLRKMIDLEVGIFDGLSSHWDYENDRWK